MQPTHASHDQKRCQAPNDDFLCGGANHSEASQSDVSTRYLHAAQESTNARTMTRGQRPVLGMNLNSGASNTIVLGQKGRARSVSVVFMCKKNSHVTPKVDFRIRRGSFTCSMTQIRLGSPTNQGYNLGHSSRHMIRQAGFCSTSATPQLGLGSLNSAKDSVASPCLRIALSLWKT